MSIADNATAPPPTYPWPWCRSETTTTVGTVRLTAHAGAPTHGQVPPDELTVYLIAVDGETPNVVIESVTDDPTAMVLAVDQAQRLAAAVAATVATATT